MKVLVHGASAATRGGRLRAALDDIRFLRGGAARAARVLDSTRSGKTADRSPSIIVGCYVNGVAGKTGRSAPVALATEWR